MTQKPRIPGSRHRPIAGRLFTDGVTASTHSKIPLDQATAGQRYRVRDKDWAMVWDDDLSYDDAVKLRERVVTSRKSTTARVENMDVAPPDWYIQDAGGAHGSQQVGDEAGYRFCIEEGGVEHTAPATGAVVGIVSGHELLVNGQVMPVPTTVQAGDRVMARPLIR